MKKLNQFATRLATALEDAAIEGQSGRVASLFPKNKHMTDKLYYKNSLVDEGDYSEIAMEFGLTYDIVAEVLAQMSVTGEPLFAQYMGLQREAVRSMANAITVEPESAVSASYEPMALSEEEEVIDNAAVSLMTAMAGPGDGSFIITPEGICTVNPKNPPELIQAYQVVSRVLKLRELGDVMDDKSSWMLGSVVSELETYFGENFEASQVSNDDTRSYNTIYTAVKVYEAFKNKRYKTTFTNHKEAFFAKITDAAKALILRKTETFDLKMRDVRALCSIVKKMDGDTTMIENITTKEMAEALIEKYKKDKVNYIVLDNNEWWQIKGSASSIPTGRLVIDLKNMTARKDNGEPIEIQKPTKKKTK